MPEGDKPLEQRPKAGRGRTGSSRVIVRRNIIDNTTTLYVPTEAPRPLAATVAPPATSTDVTAASPPTDSSDDSDNDDEAPHTITTTVSVHTQGGELVKRPRPSTSSSGCSDEQEDKRVKLTRPALPGPIEHKEPPPSPTPLPRQAAHRAPLTLQRSLPPPPRRSPPPPPTEPPPPLPRGACLCRRTPLCHDQHARRRRVRPISILLALGSA